MQTKKLWEGVNQIIASKSKSNSTINCLEINDDNNNKTNITNPKQTSNFANKYYTNIRIRIYYCQIKIYKHT